MSDDTTDKDVESHSSSQYSLDVSEEVKPIPGKQEIYFWEKWASEPETEDEDKCICYEVKEDDISIREVLREFENKPLGKKRLFSEVPIRKNPSVRKWIIQIMESYPNRRDDVVEDLLNAFRVSLGPKSRERYKFIVGLLLLKDVLLLIHSKKDRSLAQWKGNIHPVNLILYRKNALRAAIIKNENGINTFSAFEHNRNWSRGHADFWGIEPEDVGWESLGSIVLYVELNTFDYPLQLPIESEHLDLMIRNSTISPTGFINIGREKGKITQVEVFRKMWEFNEFYDYYITQKEQLIEFRRLFEKIFLPDSKNRIIYEYDRSLEDKYKYKEDLDKIYEFGAEGDKLYSAKKHPRFTIVFATKEYPRIKPSERLIYRIYKAIFENEYLEIWHAGEDTSNEPTHIGEALEIYNKIDTDSNFLEFSSSLLNLIKDCNSRKASYTLQAYFCSFWYAHLKNIHIRSIFEFIKEEFIVPELEHQFKNGGIFDKEDYLEFKSADDVDAKSSNFINKTLLPTIRKYIKDGNISRKCIFYGIEENGSIKPVSRRLLRSDEVGRIEKVVNKELEKDNINVILQPIPVEEDVVLAVLLLQDIKKGAIGELATLSKESIRENP
jgi:hypothetical protein